MSTQTRGRIITATIVATAAVAAVVGSAEGWINLGTAGSFVAIAALALVYFVPTIVAARREHGDLWPILIINVLTGWTIIGWLTAMVWAMSPEMPRAKTTEHPTGDVVNGYVYDGQGWQPMERAHHN